MMKASANAPAQSITSKTVLSEAELPEFMFKQIFDTARQLSFEVDEMDLEKNGTQATKSRSAEILELIAEFESFLDKLMQDFEASTRARLAVITKPVTDKHLLDKRISTLRKVADNFRRLEEVTSSVRAEFERHGVEFGIVLPREAHETFRTLIHNGMTIVRRFETDSANLEFASFVQPQTEANEILRRVSLNVAALETFSETLKNNRQWMLRSVRNAELNV